MAGPAEDGAAAASQLNPAAPPWRGGRGRGRGRGRGGGGPYRGHRGRGYGRGASLVPRADLRWSREADASGGAEAGGEGAAPAPAADPAVAEKQRELRALIARKKREREEAAEKVAAQVREVEERKKRLKREIQDKKEAAARAAKAKAQQEALREAVLKSKKEAEHKQKVARLAAGFGAIAERPAAGAADEAAPAAPAARTVADEREVKRVLGCLNNYQIFGVAPSAEGGAIRKAYLKLSRSLHPDKCKVPGATDAFQRVTKAYKDLMSSRG